MASRMRLLCPEWQGCKSPKVHAGARWLADVFFKGENHVCIDAPVQEELHWQDGVIGIASIAPRFLQTCQLLSELKPSHLFMIGGTCGTEAAPISYLNNLYAGDLAVVWLDAHADMNTPQTSPSGDFHGMVLRTLLGEGPPALCSEILRPLTASQVFLAGTRNFDLAEQEYITQSQVPIFSDLTSAAVRRLQEAIENAGFRRVYIHLDVDVLNPLSFSDSLMPTAGGPGLNDISECLESLRKSFDVVGTSIVEYCGQSEQSRNQLLQLIAGSGNAVSV